MNLNELGQLVYACEQEIKTAKEKISSSVFEYATSVFKDGQRVIYRCENYYLNGKEYEIVLRRPTDCKVTTNSLWGTMLYVSCLPVKKNGEVAKIGLQFFPIEYLEPK